MLMTPNIWILQNIPENIKDNILKELVLRLALFFWNIFVL